jgi:prolyl oligopeptidase
MPNSRQFSVLQRPFFFEGCRGTFSHRLHTSSSGPSAFMRELRTVMLGCVMLIVSTTSGVRAQTNTTALTYPPALRGNVVDDFHGEKVADPYRWLEDLDSPETRAWVVAEAKLTEKYLENLPSRKPLRERLTQLMDHEKYGAPFRRQNRYFYTYNRGLDPQSILYKSIGLNGAPTVLLDPNKLSPDGTSALVGYNISDDGKTLVYGLAQGGGDWTDWHFRDVDTGTDLPDVVRWTKYYPPVFAPDGRAIYYSNFPAPRAGEELSARDLGNAVYYHAFGTPAASDQKIYERPEHPDWQFQLHITPGSSWLVLTCGEGEVGDKNLMNVYAVDLSSARREIIPLAEGFDAAYLYVGADAGLLYFQTSLDAPRGRVIAIDPKHPERARWQTAVAQQADSMDFAAGSVTLVNHQLIVRTLHDVHTQVKIFNLRGDLQRKIELPGAGSAFGFGGIPTDSDTFYLYTDLITPATVFHLDLQAGKSSPYRSPKVAFDPAAYEAKQIFYASKDGTRVPMFLVHKKGLKLDGTNPTLLYAYGGFGISTLPTFHPTRVAWLEHGGLFAIANIRGGGEYGEDWHKQAIRDHRQVAFDDFIVAAEWLMAQHYTSPAKLAIEGGSNGGLLVGACVTQRPDLYGAVLAYVGVMDMLRFHKFGQGAGWIGDFGSPDNPDDFKALRAYSPYHNVRSATRYPAIMVITGDHDTRVMPAHSFKFAAALQAAQTGPAPILLRVHLSAGHGGGVTTNQRIEEEADAYSFLFKNLGM